eukprot:jgi/Mesvir1/7160/Mv02520-RA.1
MEDNNVGILAMEVHFPSNYVQQSELEHFDGVSAGKYTIGLGQNRMAFCDDREDIISICMTVAQRLFDKYHIDPASIGRLDVGTETLIDKSKSIKTALMSLFTESGNFDVEGVDNINACYGGTAALFNAMNWVESSACDGRYALVVTGDIAVYAEGAARPTGGVGAVAMLIGKDAPLAVERKLTSSYMTHAYDFYKPKLASEYPVVDGQLSNLCYLTALDECFRLYAHKYARLVPEAMGQPFRLDQADYLLFHAPYNKLVQKSYARLVYNDFVAHHDKVVPELEPLRPFIGLTKEETFTNRELEKAAMAVSRESFRRRVEPSCLLPQECGNMYTASLYSGLASLVHLVETPQLLHKRLLLFSYGSGLASSMFSIRARVPSGEDAQPRFSLAFMATSLNLEKRLAARTKVSPADFVKTLELMETRYGNCGYSPNMPVDHVPRGVFYLTGVDDRYRRSYKRRPLADVPHVDDHFHPEAAEAAPIAITQVA